MGQGSLKAKGRKEGTDEGLQRCQGEHTVAAGELLEDHRIGGGAQHGRHLQAVAEQGVGGKLIHAATQPQQGNADDGDGKAEQLAATDPLLEQHKSHQGHDERQQGTDHARLTGTGVTQGIDLQQEVKAGLQSPHQGQPAPIPF